MYFISSPLQQKCMATLPSLSRYSWHCQHLVASMEFCLHLAGKSRSFWISKCQKGFNKYHNYTYERNVRLTNNWNYRLFYAGAVEGQMPEILSMIQVNKMTPAPAVLIVVSYAIFVILFYFYILRIIPQLKQRHVAKYCKALEKQTFMNYDKISFINRNIIQIDQYTSTVHVCVSVDHNLMW